MTVNYGRSKFFCVVVIWGGGDDVVVYVAVATVADAFPAAENVCVAQVSGDRNHSWFFYVEMQVNATDTVVVVIVGGVIVVGVVVASDDSAVAESEYTA